MKGSLNINETSMKDEGKFEKYQNGEMYKKVCKIYRDLVGEYFGLDSKLFPPKEETMNERWKRDSRKLTARAKKARKTMKKIKKVVEVCRKLDVPVETYMKTQFKIIYPDFIKSHPRGVISLGWLTSVNAVERFNQKASGKDKKINIEGVVKASKAKKSDIDRSMLSSVKALERRLLGIKEVMELNRDVVNEELQRLSRFKKIKAPYIYSSNYIKEHGSRVLKAKQKIIGVKLTEEEKEKIREFKDNYNFNEEIAEYVR